MRRRRLAELDDLGVAREDRATWTRPVVWIPCPEGGPFVEAGTAPVLWDAYDQLIGPNRWPPRQGVGGHLPVRFPAEVDPEYAGWHFDSGTPRGDKTWASVHSPTQALLSLFLFTDVGKDDSPTPPPSEEVTSRWLRCSEALGMKDWSGARSSRSCRRPRSSGRSCRPRERPASLPLSPIPGAPGVVAPPRPDRTDHRPTERLAEGAVCARRPAGSFPCGAGDPARPRPPVEHKDGGMSDYVAVNRADWDSRLPHHVAAYGLELFRDDPEHLSGWWSHPAAVPAIRDRATTGRRRGLGIPGRVSEGTSVVNPLSPHAPFPATLIRLYQRAVPEVENRSRK